MSALDAVASFVKLVASALVDGEPVYSVTAIGGFTLGTDGTATDTDDSDDGGEQSAEQVGYAALGIIGRPLPPDGDLFAEALAIRVDGGLSPVGWRDMRLHRAINPGGGSTTPAEGQIMLVGYGGSFLSFAVNEAGASIATLYVPFEFDGDGVPTKAHAIAIDPSSGNSSITLIHADGARVALTENGISWAIDAETFGAMRAGEFTVNAARIMLKGNVYVGAAAELGIPLLAGASSPPCPSLFVSQV